MQTRLGAGRRGAGSRRRPTGVLFEAGEHPRRDSSEAGPDPPPQLAEARHADDLGHHVSEVACGAHVNDRDLALVLRVAHEEVPPLHVLERGRGDRVDRYRHSSGVVDVEGRRYQKRDSSDRS